MLTNLWQRCQWLLAKKQLKIINVVVLDVDGVLTDKGLWFGPQGDLIKRFDVRDGLGIKLLQSAGFRVVFLSGGCGGSTQARAKQLGITHCIVGAKDKLSALNLLRQELDINFAEIAFVGDDVNDLVVRGKVGLLIATSDAALPVRQQADLVLSHPGGHGAVRELAENLLKIRGLWQQLSKLGWRDRND
jgi:3-deoxy-D-manno-octulosonate 8-phosphate phosphatase (KDO 8-P phosphatase)